jgi:hypothetical protein
VSGRTVRAALGGFLGGLVVGLVVWSEQVHRARHDLFRGNIVRRRAALGFLRAQWSAGTVRVLREYVSWERQPSLRRRGAAILRRMEEALE